MTFGNVLNRAVTRRVIGGGVNIHIFGSARRISFVKSDFVDVRHKLYIPDCPEIFCYIYNI